MKIAITGKGGAGKSTIAGMLARIAQAERKTVLAVDADPAANLAFALVIPESQRAEIIPISKRTELIEERTGAKLKQFGQIFRLNPEISDVVDKFCFNFQGIHLLVLGAVEKGGSGCACPENVFLRNLLTHIILKRDEFVIVDLEAGIEHLGRATAQGVDMMVIVVEPASQSISVAHQIIKMATEIGVKNIRIVGNKIYNPEEFSFIKSKFMNNSLSGYIPYSDLIRSVDVQGSSLYENLDTELLNHFKTIYKNILVSV